jgi:hypothetical protein
VDADAAIELLLAVALVVGAVAIVPIGWAIGRRMRRLTLDGRARTARISLDPPTCDDEDTDPDRRAPPPEK